VQEKKSTEEAEFSREHLPDGFSYNLDSNELNNDLFSVDKTSVDGVFTSPSKSDDDTSLIAVAGSNGTVIIWRTSTLLTEDKKSRRLKQDIWNQKSVLLHYHYNSSLESEDPVELAGEPEAILVEHSRPVTSLAWHPKKRGYLLTASQDGYVKLWERRANEESGRDRAQNSMLRWMNRPQNSSQQSYSWSCKEEFKTKLNNDQINQVKWSPWINNLFAMGTQEGFLIICRADNMASKRLPLVSVLAHHSDVSTIDWHPTRKYIIATGGSDRTVKGK
jgi:WD40 repeat protein